MLLHRSMDVSHATLGAYGGSTRRGRCARGNHVCALLLYRGTFAKKREIVQGRANTTEGTLRTRARVNKRVFPLRLRLRLNLRDLDDGRVIFEQLLRLTVARELHVKGVAIHLGDRAAAEYLVIDLVVHLEGKRCA